MCFDKKNVLIQNDNFDGLLCPICGDIVEDGVVIGQCGHLFGRKCLNRWIEEKTESVPCPLCRASFIQSDVIPSSRLNRILSQIQFNCPWAGCKVGFRKKSYVTTYTTLSHLYDGVVTNQPQLKMKPSSNLSS